MVSIFIEPDGYRGAKDWELTCNLNKFNGTLQLQRAHTIVFSPKSTVTTLLLHTAQTISLEAATALIGRHYSSQCTHGVCLDGEAALLSRRQSLSEAKQQCRAGCLWVDDAEGVSRERSRGHRGAIDTSFVSTPLLLSLCTGCFVALHRIEVSRALDHGTRFGSGLAPWSEARQTRGNGLPTANAHVALRVATCHQPRHAVCCNAYRCVYTLQSVRSFQLLVFSFCVDTTQITKLSDTQ